MIDYTKPITDENGNKIKLLEVASHFCIRCVKKGRALLDMGYEVHSLAAKVSFGQNIFTSSSLWQNEDQFKHAIRNYINLGIRGLTWNNEPDKPATWIKEVINEMNMQDKVKLIVDIHDADSVRRNFIPIEEREMINSADGILYASMPIEEKLNKLHAVKVPTRTIYSYCNRGVVQYKEEDIPIRRGLVYEGGVNPVNNDQLNKAFPYRNLHHIMKQLVEQGNELSMFVGNLDGYQTLHDTGAILYPPTNYTEMMNALIKYKYGVIVFNNKSGKEAQVEMTLTNKESEYLHAGLPTLACWCPETEKHVLKHGTGFVFSDIEEIGNCSQLESRYYEVMDNIKRKREELCMENYIVLLENMYANILGLEKKGIPEHIQKLHDFEFKT